MLDKKQNKIVILEENHTRRDYLKSIVSQASDLSFCFGQVANCFDNLFHLNPDLIVVGSLPREDIIRFINAHSATQCDFPSILITKDLVVKRYLKLNNDRGIFFCDSELSLAQYKKYCAENTQKPSAPICWRRFTHTCRQQSLGIGD